MEHTVMSQSRTELLNLANLQVDPIHFHQCFQLTSLLFSLSLSLSWSRYLTKSLKRCLIKRLGKLCDWMKQNRKLAHSSTKIITPLLPWLLQDDIIWPARRGPLFIRPGDNIEMLRWCVSSLHPAAGLGWVGGESGLVLWSSDTSAAGTLAQPQRGTR